MTSAEQHDNHLPSPHEPRQATNIFTKYTLIVPTYNRPALLRQITTYFTGIRKNMNLLVLDSSSPEVIEKNRAMLRALTPSPRHIIYPHNMPPATKLAAGLREVKTSYVSFCGDDDLVLPDGLQEALDFLDSHPDHACAHGLYLNLREDNSNVHITSEYSGGSIEAGHPGARIFQLLEKYEALFYAVFRTEDLAEIFAGVNQIPSLHYQELFLAVATLIKGKAHRFPRFYAIRRSGPPAQPNRDHWESHNWFVENRVEYLQHYLAYRDVLQKFYDSNIKSSSSERDFFSKVLDITHTMYFSTGFTNYVRFILENTWPSDLMGVYRRDILKTIEPERPEQPSPKIGTIKALLQRLCQRLNRIPAKEGQEQDHAATLAELNKEIQSASKTPWTCHLPSGLLWLAANSDFRATYQELCRYLDHGAHG